MATCQDLVNVMSNILTAVQAVAINVDAVRAEIICLKEIHSAAFVNREVIAKHFANQEIILTKLTGEIRDGLASVREGVTLTETDELGEEILGDTSDELLIPFPPCSVEGVYCPPGQMKDPETGQCVPIGGV